MKFSEFDSNPIYWEMIWKDCLCYCCWSIKTRVCSLSFTILVEHHPRGSNSTLLKTLNFKSWSCFTCRTIGKWEMERSWRCL